MSDAAVACERARRSPKALPDTAARLGTMGVILWLVAPGAAFADAGGVCEAVVIPGPTQGLARVVGPARSAFVKGAGEQAGCPAETPACHATAFLVPGNLVIVGDTHGAFTCADYIGRTGRHRAGWLPTASLVRLPPAVIKTPDWLGRWEADEARLTITAAAGGRLLVDGYATSGSHDPARVGLGGINVGQFRATVTPAGDTVAFALDEDGKAIAVDRGAADGCSVRLRRLGPYLLGRDNNQCGGLNVSFDGVYRRTR